MPNPEWHGHCVAIRMMLRTRPFFPVQTRVLRSPMTRCRLRSSRFLRCCGLLLLVALGCSDDPPRDNPLDQGGTAVAAVDPGLEVGYEDGAVLLSWRRVLAIEVRGYRIFRQDRAAGEAGFSFLAEVAQPASGDRLELVDPGTLVAAPDLAWRMTLQTPFGETAAVAEVAFVSEEDLDGDGYVTGDCDAGDPAVSPDARERCNGADDDCDGEVDEACGEDLAADGEPCADDDDCRHGLCGAGGLCGAWNEPCADGCPGDLTCADDFGVCTAACGAAPCPGALACIGGWCLPSCRADQECDGEARCVVPTAQPIAGGGCGLVAACGACGAAELCVAGGVGAFTCCTDADGDGRFATSCAWGTDCDDRDRGVSSGCGTCVTGDDCAGAQCVLLTSGEGLCGGPAGCHCPDGTACVTSEEVPRCVQRGTCVDSTDCEIAEIGRWQCRPVATLGSERRCVCDDPSVCPECLVDAECAGEATCDAGRCVQP